MLDHVLFRSTVPVALPRALRLALLLALLLGMASGCSADDAGCRGETYELDLGAEGAQSPILALQDWLGAHEGLGEPPGEGGVVQETGEADPDRVVLTNEDGDGWWVSAVRTDDGGYVVDQATDDWASCEDDLS